MSKFDAAVVGGGPGGYECAIRLSQNGLKTVLIEQRQQDGLGGTCLNRGCIPTKTLLHCADVYAEAKEASQFGISVESVSFDYKKFKERKDSIAATLRRGIQGLLKSHDVTVVFAHAVLTDRNTLQLSNGDSITADKIVLATGSSPVHLPIPGADLPGVVDSTGLLDMDTCPKKMVIVGGGVVGIEFAALFSMLGTEVTILEMLDTILAPFDTDISSAIRTNLEKNHVKIITGVRVTAIQEGLIVTYTDKDGTQGSAEGEIVLMAGGRRPNSANLGLEQVGIRTTCRGHVDTDGLCRTNIPNIYAIGDLNGKLELAHAASAQGLVAAAHAAGLPCKEVERTRIPSCIFTKPEAAAVGLTEQQARDTGREIGIGLFSLSGNGKAMVMGQNTGMVKIIFDKITGEILGAHILAPRATDMIGEIVSLMNAEGTIDELANSVHPHPTINEAIMEAAHAAHGNCVNAPRARKKH